MIRKHHSIAPGDYPDQHLRWAVLESINAYQDQFRRGIRGTIEFSFRKFKIPVRQSRFVVSHVVHSIGFNSSGKLETIRHRFGPANPEPDHIPDDIHADAWAVMAYFHTIPDVMMQFYPWFKQLHAVSLQITDLKKWIRETSALIRTIEDETHFDYRPGPHCLVCPYEIDCPALKPVNRSTVIYDVIHDPMVRIARYHSDALEQIRRLKESVVQSGKLLIDSIHPGKDRIIRDVDGTPILKVNIVFALPKKGTESRKKLERMLCDLRYSKRIKTRDILEWLNQVPVPDKIRNKVMQCFVQRYRLSSVDPGIPAPADDYPDNSPDRV